MRSIVLPAEAARSSGGARWSSGGRWPGTELEAWYGSPEAGGGGTRVWRRRRAAEAVGLVDGVGNSGEAQRAAQCTKKSEKIVEMTTFTQGTHWYR